MKNKNIIAVQNLIRCLGIESLRNSEVVANLVRAFGLVQWGPSASFGEDEIFRNSSEEMAGIYQIPDQIAEALIYLSNFEINSFLEIGVFQGGNFLFVSEYLRRFNLEVKCYGIDPAKFLNPEIRQIIDKEKWLIFSPINSNAIAGQQFDLVFIDGEHTAEWVRRDWENVGKHAKICMLHDIQGPICPDVVAFWDELKAKYPNRMIKECLKGNQTKGIGIIHNG